MRKLSKKERGEVVTKGYLEDAGMVTKDFFVDYLEKTLESKNYVTKDYLENRFIDFRKEIKNDMRDLRKNVANDMKKLRENLVDEIGALFEDRVYYIVGSFNDYRVKVDEHEYRITKLEQENEL